jgi:hypothetical protein
MSMSRKRSASFIRIALIAIAGVLLTACGGGNGDDEPTATPAPVEAQPTVEATEDAATGVEKGTPAQTLPANTDMSSPDAIGTPAETEATPGGVATSEDSPSESSPVATAFEDAPVEATPSTGGPVDLPAAEAADASPGATTISGGTPSPKATAGGEAPAGDGTTGAALPPLEEGTSAATPTAAVGSTPVAVASPPASPVSGTPVAAAQPPVVNSCDIADVPAFTGEGTTYVLNVDLNFRAGPGSDCDIIGDGPLGEFSDVEVIGGPVIREGDDTPEWVQVQVGEQTGWLAWEFLEPVE